MTVKSSRTQPVMMTTTTTTSSSSLSSSVDRRSSSIPDHLTRHRRRSSIAINKRRRQFKSIILSIMWLGLVNIFMLYTFHPGNNERQLHIHRSLSSFRESRRRLRNLKNTDDVVVLQPNDDDTIRRSSERNNELRCTDYGGPQSPGIYTEMMMYWDRNNETKTMGDATKKFLQQQNDNNDEELYLTFESDHNSGLNGIRLVWETATALAFAMNRTLVLPPRQSISKLQQEYDGSWRRQATTFTFMDLYEMENDNSLQQVPMITTEEFLERMSLLSLNDTTTTTTKERFLLRDVTTNEIVPSLSRWDWDDEEHPHELEEYLRRIGHNHLVETTTSPKRLRTAKDYRQQQDPSSEKVVAVTKASSWNPQECILLLGNDIQDADDERFTNKTMESFTKVIYEEDQTQYNMNSSLSHRFQEIYAGRTQLCTYDQERRNQRVLHLPNNVNRRGILLMVPFYTFILSQYGYQDVLLRNYIRNHVRYSDELQCAAARIVEYLQEVIVYDDYGDYEPSYYAIHLRRGNFVSQYQSATMDANDILNQTQPEIPFGSTIFVASDHNDNDEDDLDTFLIPFRSVHANVITMQDLLNEPSLGLQDINSNLLGMIEQLVCARAKVFFGHSFSTYSAYIARLRGYHYDKQQRNKEHQGEETYFYAPAGQKYLLQEETVVHKPFHSREFPMGWRME